MLNLKISAILLSCLFITGKPLSVTAVNNGLNIDGQGVVSMGGKLTKNTVINTDGYGIHIGLYNDNSPFVNGTNSISGIEGKAPGYGAFSFGTSSIASGDLSVALGGRNAIASGVGSINIGTDGESRGNYGFVANDANFNYGESGTVFGFGSSNWTRQGFVVGGDNSAGSLSGAGTKNQYVVNTLFGEQIKTQGNYISCIGNRVQITGDNITFIGSGYSTGNMVYGESNSFAVGYNSNVPTFIVHGANGMGTYGITEIKGLLKLTGVPTSSMGLPSGVIWSNNGVLTLTQ
jgi:hypothetical protein